MIKKTPVGVPKPLPGQRKDRSKARGNRAVAPKLEKNEEGDSLHRNEELIRQINKQYTGDKIDAYMGNVNLPTEKSLFDYDKDRMDAIKASCQNILYFAENFFYIVNNDQGKIVIKLHDFQKDMLQMFMENRKNIVCTSRQVGKALALDTPIPTPSGWTTMGELKDGDMVYGRHGNPTKVVKAWEVMYDRPCYEITFDNGEKIVADENHNWWGNFGKDNLKLTTKDLLETYKEFEIPTCKKYNDFDSHRIVNIKKVESVPVRCITVENVDELFLCGKTYIPTKNTTIMCIYVLWLVTFFEYQKVVIVANKERTAKEILERIKLAYQELPGWLKPSVDRGGWSKESINFGNGSTVRISATSADAIRGLTVSTLLVDEMAHIDESIVQEFWSAVYPTISSSEKSKVLIASTPNGMGNLFHTLWDNAESHKNGFNRLSVTWREAGKSEEWAIAEEATMGSREMFLQEYECVFLQSNQSPIAEELFQFLKQRCYDPEFLLDEDRFKIWEKPNLEDGVYVAGCDTCEGVGGNNGVMQIFDLTDLTNIKQVAQYIANDVHPHDYAKRMNDILELWGKPPLAIERNGTSGGMILETMINTHHYPHIIDFERGNVLHNSNKGNLRGIKANNTTKSPSVSNMFYYLKERRVVELRDVETLNELRTYVRSKNAVWGKISDKCQDDRVDALVWALVVLDPKVIDQYYITEMKDVNGRPLHIRRGYTVYSTKKEHDDYRFLFPSNDYDNLPVPYVTNGDGYTDEITELQANGWMFPTSNHQQYSGYIGW